MERFIEVIGEGQFTEVASRFIAAVVSEIRAAKDETALTELAELFRDAINTLRDAGITDEPENRGRRYRLSASLVLEEASWTK